MNAELLKALAVTAEITGTKLSEAALEVMASDLESYPSKDVLQALTDLRRTLTGRLTLAVIVSELQGKDGHPGPEEAWSIAHKGADETNTVVWTEQISQAFFEAAAPLMEAGDQIAARMAFRESYEARLREARAKGERPEWGPSLGWDFDKRHTAIAEAVQQGRLSQRHLDALPDRSQPHRDIIKAIENKVLEHKHGAN